MVSRSGKETGVIVGLYQSEQLDSFVVSENVYPTEISRGFGSQKCQSETLNRLIEQYIFVRTYFWDNFVFKGNRSRESLQGVNGKTAHTSSVFCCCFGACGDCYYGTTLYGTFCILVW